MENRVCFTFFKPNVSQRLFTLRLFTLPRSLPSLSCYTLPRSLPSRFLSLPHPFPSVSLTLFDQTPLPVPWSLSYPFRTLTVPTAVDYRYIALPFYCFVLHLFYGKWMIIRGGSRITKIFNFFPFVLWVWCRFRFCVGKKIW